MLHSCSFDSAKIRLFTENGGFFRLCFYQQKANTACLLFFCTNYHDCTTNFQQFIASAGAHRIIGGDSHRQGSHRFYRQGSRHFSSAGIRIGMVHAIFHRRGFTPAGVYTGRGLHRLPNILPPLTGFPRVPTQSPIGTAYQQAGDVSPCTGDVSPCTGDTSVEQSRSDAGYSAGVK